MKGKFQVPQTAHEPSENFFLPSAFSIAKLCVEPTYKLLLSNKKAYNKRNKERKTNEKSVCLVWKRATNATHFSQKTIFLSLAGLCALSSLRKSISIRKKSFRYQDFRRIINHEQVSLWRHENAENYFCWFTFFIDFLSSEKFCLVFFCEFFFGNTINFHYSAIYKHNSVREELLWWRNWLNFHLALTLSSLCLQSSSALYFSSPVEKA